MSTRAVLVAALALAAGARPAAAQSLAERLRQVGTGPVRFSFAARPDVCGNGENISWGRGRDRDWASDCVAGPVRVSLELARGTLVRLRTRVGGRWTAAAAGPDLGLVPAREAAAWFLAQAEGAGPKGEDAILPVILADSVEAWPRLLDLARNPGAPARVRKSALFWVGQAAAEEATAGLAEVAGDAGAEREVREAAVFALSQRPAGEGVPALLRVARTDRDPKVRRSAIFWLGQGGDPRAVAFFEEVLTTRGGGR